MANTTLKSSLLKRLDSDNVLRWRWEPSPETFQKRKVAERRRAEEKKRADFEASRIQAEKEQKERAENKRRAHNALRIAIDYLDVEMYSDKVLKSEYANHLQQSVLQQAAEQVAKARKLDPAAAVQRKKTDEKNNQFTETSTVDDLSAEMLFIEGLLHLGTVGRRDAQVDSAITSGDSFSFKYYSQKAAKEDKEVRTKALKTFEKFLHYRPNNMPAMRHIAQLHYLMGDKQALAMANKLMELDADDIENIKLYEKIHEEAKSRWKFWK